MIIDTTGSLSTLSSILYIVISVKQLMREMSLSFGEGLSHFKEIATSQEKMLLANEEILTTVSDLSVISDALLNQLRQDILDCESEHINKLQIIGKNQHKRDNVAAEAKKCICHGLKEIIRFNNGKLPPAREFADWWDSYRCDKKN